MSESPHPPLRAIPPGITRAADYEALAPRFIAAPTLAYLAGGSGDDRTLRWNREAFARWRFRPRALAPLDDCDTATALPGRRQSHPLLLAPVAYQGLVHPAAEVDTARGAAAADTLMIVSSLATRPLEDVVAAAGAGCWYQLTFGATRDDTLRRLRRAENAGCEALVVTVDAAAQLPSQRALRAGFRLPAGLAAETPPPVAQASSVVERYRHAAVTRDDLLWLLDVAGVPVVVKGILHEDDAGLCRELGVAGIVVSNHGGRSVDGVAASLDVLPKLRSAAGSGCCVLFDGGIRAGEDVLKAIAAGADAVLLGRLQVYALAVAGALGVAHMLRTVRQELELYMAITGCASLEAARAPGFLAPHPGGPRC